jgi:hypothetical protein
MAVVVTFISIPSLTDYFSSPLDYLLVDGWIDGQMSSHDTINRVALSCFFIKGLKFISYSLNVLSLFAE